MSNNYFVELSKKEIKIIDFILKKFLKFDGFFKDIKYSSFSGIFRFLEFKEKNKEVLSSIQDKLKETGVLDE